MDKIGGAASIVIALFLLVSMVMQFDTLVTAGIAVAALVVLAAYEFILRARTPRV